MKIYLLFLLFFLTSCFSGIDTNQEKKAKLEQMAQAIDKKFSKVKQLSVKEFKQIPSNQVVLVDVRTPQERKVSMLPNAISKDEFLSNTKKYQGKKVVAYCTIGYRSSEFINKLKDRFPEAYNLRGSLLSWAHDDGQFFHEGQNTSQVHVYGRAWNLLPDSYEPVY